VKEQKEELAELLGSLLLYKLGALTALKSELYFNMKMHYFTSRIVFY
jgi:hypothetical protein